MKSIIIKALSVTFLSLVSLFVSAQATNIKEKKETVKSETKNTKAGVESDVKDANENLKSNTKSAKEEVNSDAKEVNSDVKEIKNEVVPTPPKKKGLNLDLGSPTQPAGLAPSGKGGTNQRIINENGIKSSPSPKVNPK